MEEMIKKITWNFNSIEWYTTKRWVSSSLIPFRFLHVFSMGLSPAQKILKLINHSIYDILKIRIKVTNLPWSRVLSAWFSLPVYSTFAEQQVWIPWECTISISPSWIARLLQSSQSLSRQSQHTNKHYLKWFAIIILLFLLSFICNNRCQSSSTKSLIWSDLIWSDL